MRHDCLLRASFSVAMKLSQSLNPQNQNIQRLEDDKLKTKNTWAVSEKHK